MNGEKNKTDVIMLSIIVATYNHERYIRKAIESILNQEMDFSYEVLIGEDCSTDSTKEILQMIQPKLPHNFHIFFRKKNMGQEGGNNFRDLYSRARGKYIIVLEGDDYWVYSKKLKKQVEFLEAHPEYVAVAHNTFVVDDNDCCLKEIYPECKEDEYSFEAYRNEVMAGQTTTILRRNPLLCHNYKDVKISVYYPGDQKTNFILLCNGKVKCIQEKWSAYRHVINYGSSYSATHKDDAEYSRRRLVFLKEMVDFTRAQFNDKKQACQCIESIYMYYLFKDIWQRADMDSTIQKWMAEFCSVNNKADIVLYIGKRIFRKIKSKII